IIAENHAKSSPNLRFFKRRKSQALNANKFPAPILCNLRSKTKPPQHTALRPPVNHLFGSAFF
ncbi:MAG: hypothetical protein ACI4HH_05215, partial [Hominenteromicrobium mulieris]